MHLNKGVTAFFIGVFDNVENWNVYQPHCTTFFGFQEMTVRKRTKMANTFVEFQSMQLYCLTLNAETQFEIWI